MTKKKTMCYVLDTSVLIHDALAIEKIGTPAEIIIPLGVIEELDHLKSSRKSPEVAASARVASRSIEKYRQKGDLKKGVTTDSGSKLTIEISNNGWDKLPVELAHTTDNRIILVALSAKNKKKNTHEVIILSQDTNLRIKASACGVKAEEWSHDKAVDSINELYSGMAVVEIDSQLAGYFQELASKGELPEEEFSENYQILTPGYDRFKDLHPNHCCLLKTSDDNTTVLAIYKKEKRNFVFVRKPKSVKGRICPRNMEQSFFHALLLDPEILIISGVGKAGTGKTLLALNAANMQVNKNGFRKIQVWRPNIPIGNDLGFLPGTIEEKFGPFVKPITDTMIRIVGFESKKMEEILSFDGYLSIDPINFIQGSTLDNTLIIVDEAQNVTPSQMKQIVTRVGEGSKIILIGDAEQVVNEYLDATNNGLSYLVERMKGQGVFGHILLTKGERSALAELAAGIL